MIYRQTATTAIERVETVTIDDVERETVTVIPAVEGNADYDAYLVWIEAGGEVEAYVAPSPPAASRIITPREFRMRFTATERATITLAASQALIAGDATLQVYLDDLSSATEIDLDHPEITAGLDALVDAELLTSARRDEMFA